jgi:hypothetical protein
MSVNRNLFNKICWILIALVPLGFAFSYVTAPKKSLEEYSKVVISTPIKYEVIDCGRRCSDWIEFEHKGKAFKFFQSNPFYSQFEEILSSKGYLSIWFDQNIENQIYQVSLDRKVIIPFKKLYSINNFDTSILFVIPIILLFLFLGRLNRD